VIEIVPIGLRDANAYIAAHHRHSGSVRGSKFCIAAAANGEIVGVAAVGRPVARHLDDGWTLEVNRVCTVGYRNACSVLYAASWRAARAMGYRRLVTYTLASEAGTSLRAAGWKVVGERSARKGWGSEKRPRLDLGRDGQERLLWEAS